MSRNAKPATSFSQESLDRKAAPEVMSEHTSTYSIADRNSMHGWGALTDSHQRRAQPYFAIPLMTSPGVVHPAFFPLVGSDRMSYDSASLLQLQSRSKHTP